MNKYDQRHLRNIAAYQKMVERIFKQAAADIAFYSLFIDIPEDGMFRFSDYPLTQELMDQLMARMRSDLTAVVTDGVKEEWDLSNAKNDALATSVLDVGERLPQYFKRNEEARDAFLARKEGGLTLSDRVWRYTDQFKSEIEMGLDCGIRDGLDGGQMARRLQQYLQHPDKLFRRVRDEHGNLQLSKMAAAFHPGQGVYRSSYKNARRLAATETNIAYRTADYERWQQLDFVVGIEVHLSNNHTCLGKDGKPHPFYDICDELKGKYPKDFKFTGWHPHCRCIATTITKTEAEMDADDEAILRGEQPSDPDTSENAVTELPDNFKQWVKDNTTRMVTARSMPYFISDNSGYVADVIQSAYPSRRVADVIGHSHFQEYIQTYVGRDEQFDKMLSQYYAGGMNDTGKAILIRKMKQRCIGFTIADLKKAGVVNDDFVVSKVELNSEIVKKATYKVKGKTVKVDQLTMDVIVFKDKDGKEFAYPLGSKYVNQFNKPFSAVDASQSIAEFPPYFRAGIERVSFLSRPNPLDPYWEIKYDMPNFVSQATDGGKTTFWINPSDAAEFKKYMAHEGGHILDGDAHKISTSEEWLEAVAKDDQFYALHGIKGLIRVTGYAKKSGADAEDFAECMMSYLTDHDYFKQAFPNRAAFIRLMAQRLSGHAPRR